MNLNTQDLEKITHLTLEHYNQSAEEFWEGTRNHDVRQNISLTESEGRRLCREESCNWRDSILRRARQARQLSDCRDAFDCQSSREPAGGLSPLSSKGVGDGPSTSAQGRCAQGGHLQNQACDRA